MSIEWVSSVNGRMRQLVDNGELDPDEVTRDARLLSGLILFSVAMLVVLSVVSSVAMRMLLE